MSLIKRFVKGCIKTFSKLRVKVERVIKSIVEAGRTNSYVETTSNKADTLHRHIKESDERTLKRTFESNTRKAIGRMGLGRVKLAIDPTKELYFGKNGKMNVRQIKYERGTGEAFFMLFYLLSNRDHCH
jgi:predicted RNase H-like nuclease (RuvC/YqgF family)